MRVKFKNKKQFETCYVKDISKGGIFLRTDRPRPVFEKVTVVLELPNGKTVDLRGHIVHVVERDTQHPNVAPGMGVQFDDLHGPKRDALERFLDEYVTEGRSLQARRKRPPPSEATHAALQRLLWACADATALARVSYYEVLGLTPDATVAAIQERCALLQPFADPVSPPPGAPSGGEARAAALALVLEQIEQTLTSEILRAEYDATTLGIVR